MKFKIVRMVRLSKVVEAEDEFKAYEIAQALFDEDFTRRNDDIEVFEEAE